MSPAQARGTRWFCKGMVTLALLGLIASVGCTRRFYRNKTDSEVARLLKEKDVIPEWQIENYHVYPDSRARFADPTNPDRPPMPPDDPAAKLLSTNPQKPGHAGIGRHEGTGYLDLLATWDAQNRSALAVTPAAPEANPIQQVGFKQATTTAQAKPKLEQLPIPRPATLGAPSVAPLDVPPPVVVPPVAPPTVVAPGHVTPTERPATLGPAIAGPTIGDADCPTQPYLITLEQAVELGLINSREFQTRREDLYLAALPVSLARFGFAFQVSAAEQAIREYTGANIPPGKGDRWRLNSDVGVTKLFSTGALLLFQYANRTVIDMSGRMNLLSVSTINLDLVQPLLRGGGKAVTLEPLTLVERNLLYEIRDYARFRKEYFQFISAGGDLINLGGAGGGFGSAESPGTVSLGSGNPARPQILPGAAGRIDLGGGTSIVSEGYLPTEQRKGVVNIERQNVERLEGILKLFQAYEEGGEVSSLQVGQVQLDLLGAQSRVLQRQQEYRDSLDRFKLQLGLPPPLPLELDETHIRPLLDQYNRFETVLQQFEAVVKQVETYDRIDEPDVIRDRVRKLFTESPFVAGTKVFKTTIMERWQRWTQDQIDDKELGVRLQKLYAEKRRLLDLQTDREQEEKTLTPEETRLLAVTLGDLSLGEMELTMRQYERVPWKKQLKERDQKEIQAQAFRLVRSSVVEVLGEANNERLALIRPLWPTLPGIEINGVDLVRGDLEAAYGLGTATAIDLRLDLMNARARLVDSWRQVAIFANSLLGTFNVGYHLDSSTPPDQAKPLAFQPSRTRHQLFFNAELPLVRLAEQNAYRAALIAYQRARRALMAAEDAVAATIRTEIRQLQVLARTYQIQQRSVELAFQQVESSLETFRAPQAPGGGGSNAASVAALTQQLLGAYRGLPQAQIQLLTIWIQYQVARQQLYLDLELMPLDSRGVWIDELSYRNDLGYLPDFVPVNP